MAQKTAYSFVNTNMTHFIMIDAYYAINHIFRNDKQIFILVSAKHKTFFQCKMFMFFGFQEKRRNNMIMG